MTDVGGIPLDIRSIEADFARLGIEGLTSVEVDARVRDGKTNAVVSRTSRSYADILRANVFTWFNLILGILWVLMVSFGSFKDALFGFVLLFNTGIGIVQEVRAKTTLDRLSLVTAPKTRVLRDGVVQEVVSADVVLDDIVFIESGDQVIVDGTSVWVDGLEVDESFVTGESLSVVKASGESVVAGSFVVAGRGAFEATAVGADTRAQRMTAQGRSYMRVDSEVMNGINSILKTIGVAMIPVAALTVFASLRTTGTTSARITDVVATLVAMVPEGLVLLSSIAFAASMVVLAQHKVLANELAAVEVLARTDVVCADKTGTLTEPQPAFIRFDSISTSRDDDFGHEESLAALGAHVALGGTGNSTIEAIRRGVSANDAWHRLESVPFSSDRKWSGSRFEGKGTWILGAPEVLLGALPLVTDVVRERALTLAGEGFRVVMLARTDEGFSEGLLPEGMEPRGFVLLAEKVRSDAAETVRYLGDQGIELKVLSGDSVSTVSAIAEKATIPGSGDAVDARSLSGQTDLADIMERTTIFGRVAPEQKALMVEALQANNHTVAMVGDGVNDVLAIKAADLGIAMGSGAPATKAVAQLVLLDGRFAVMPLIMAEGRRVIANAERVANLFLVKTIWAVAFALLFGFLAQPYPFLPRQITLVGSLTIGIPAFFLALAPNARRYQSGFVRRVVRFAIPVGIIVAITVFAVYTIGRNTGMSLEETRTACTIALMLLGSCVIVVLEYPLRGWRLALVASILAAMVLVYSIPFTRGFFALTLLPLPEILQVIGVTAVGCALLLVFGMRMRPSRSGSV
ncbi:MAG: HAD-IC family P-type ATPase [Actinobacteria bacterium]|nr:HAD-IC family P-type ATPase [Actinomycetota bacterium]